MSEQAAGFYEVDMTGVSTTRCVALMLDGGNFGMIQIGWITWDVDHGTIEGVHVSEDYRGKGIGARLLHHASVLHGSPVGDSGEYTAEGFQWAKARGINPKMKTRIKQADMSRMAARMSQVLWGGGRNGAMVESVEDWYKVLWEAMSPEEREAATS